MRVISRLAGIGLLLALVWLFQTLPGMIADREFKRQMSDARLPLPSPRISPASTGVRPPVERTPAPPKPIAREEIIAILKKITDPELAINVVDLGLIRDVHIHPDEIVIDMVLTKIFCPYQGSIVANIKTLVGAETSRPVKIVVDYETRWKPSFMTPDGRKRWRAFLNGEEGSWS